MSFSEFTRCFSIALTLLPFSIAAQDAISKPGFNAAQQYSAARKGLGLIVWERGKIRQERYYNGHSRDTAVHIFSGTKSFFGALSAFAVEEGLLTLDEPVSKTIPEWKDDPRKAKITIRQLLNFTSGLETGFEEIYGKSSRDKVALSVSIPSKRDPGRAFIYGPSHIQVFGEVLRRKLKPKGLSYRQYLHAKILDPLGIRYTRWREDDHGNVHLSAGTHLSGRHWLNFGILLVRGGKWKGRQLVPAARLAECFRGTEINPAYGLNFWLNSYARYPDAIEVNVENLLEEEPLPEDWRRSCLCKNAPIDLVAALGSKNQRMYIVPSKQTVIVHLGDNRENDFSDADLLRRLFSR